LSDIDISIGTTAKKRLTRHNLYTANQLSDLIASKSGTLNSVAVVFGCEEHGLTKEQLELCDLVSSIPLAIKYPSLNLAQAVLIYAYELSSSEVLSSNLPSEIIEETEQKAVKKKSS